MRTPRSLALMLLSGTSSNEDRRFDWLGVLDKLLVPAMRFAIEFPSIPVQVSSVAPIIGKLGAVVGICDGAAVGVGALVGADVGVGTGVVGADVGVGAFVGARVDTDVSASAGIVTREYKAGITTLDWTMVSSSLASVYCQAKDKCSSPKPSFMSACVRGRGRAEEEGE